jgi:cytochrome c-type biogenesis protein CcmH/NrfG
MLLKKIESRPLFFDIAVGAMAERNYEIAIAHFAKVLSESPPDLPTAYLLQQAIELNAMVAP